MPTALLAVPPIARGALPLHHLRLIYEQLKRLVCHTKLEPRTSRPHTASHTSATHTFKPRLGQRNALFVARTLGRALVRLTPTLSLALTPTPTLTRYMQRGPARLTFVLAGRSLA